MPYRCLVLTYSGACRAGIVACGGVCDCMDIDITTLTGPGTCTLDIRVTDLWGAVGRKVIHIPVKSP